VREPSFFQVALQLAAQLAVADDHQPQIRESPD
jgi:hypothetical protein